MVRTRKVTGKEQDLPFIALMYLLELISHHLKDSTDFAKASESG